MKEQAPKESIAEKTRAYIDAHPSIKDCISKDLINYSSLARLIMMIRAFRMVFGRRRSTTLAAARPPLHWRCRSSSSRSSNTWPPFCASDAACAGRSQN